MQTPLLGPAATHLKVGDRVWFRHAKAGELCERVNELHLVRRAAVVDVSRPIAARDRPSSDRGHPGSDAAEKLQDPSGQQGRRA